MTCSRLTQLLVVATLCSIFTVPATAARKGGGKSRAAAKAPRSSGSAKRASAGRNANSARRMKSQPTRTKTQAPGRAKARPQFNQPTKPRIQPSAVRQTGTVRGQNTALPTRNPGGNRSTVVPENRNQGRRFSNASPPKAVRKLSPDKRKVVADRIRNSSQPRRAADTLKNKLQSQGKLGNGQARLGPFEPGPAPDERPTRGLVTTVRDFEAPNLDAVAGDKVNGYIESHKPDAPKNDYIDSHKPDVSNNDSGGFDPNDIPAPPDGPWDNLPGGPTNDSPPGDPTNDSPPGDNPPPPHNDKPCPHNNGGGHTHGGGHGDWRFRRPVFVGVGTAGRLAVRPCGTFGTACTTNCATGVCNDVVYGGSIVQGGNSVQGDTIVQRETIVHGDTLVSQPISSTGVLTDDGNEVEEVREQSDANVEPVTIYEGQTMGLPTSDLGAQPGAVTLTIGGIELKAEVLDWNANHMTFRIPELGLTQSIDGSLSIATATGEEYETIPVKLLPAEKAPQKMAEVAVGSELTLSGELGSTTGRADLEFANNLTLPVKVVSWTDGEARIAIPDLSLAEASEASLAVFNAAGELVDRISMRILP